MISIVGPFVGKYNHELRVGNRTSMSNWVRYGGGICRARSQFHRLVIMGEVAHIDEIYKRVSPRLLLL